MKPVLLSVVVLALFPAVSEAGPVDLGLMCRADAEETVRWSSAIAYGVEVSAPVVTGAHPLAEADLFGLDIGDADGLGLLASDASGGLHHRPCSTVLCSLDDAWKTLSACKDKPGCKIVGAVRLRTFHPLYLADTEGGHVCDPRWK